MSGTIRTHYRGWNIAVRCLARFGARGARKPGTVGSASAVLADPADRENWTDSRPQKTTLVNRVVSSAEVCSHVLLARVRILIDALKRKPR